MDLNTAVLIVGLLANRPTCKDLSDAMIVHGARAGQAALALAGQNLPLVEIEAIKVDGPSMSGDDFGFIWVDRYVGSKGDFPARRWRITSKACVLTKP
jgi:hypothetical protein